MNNIRTLVDKTGEKGFLLPELAKLYGGQLQFPELGNRPYVIGNFVKGIDGRVSFSDIPGHEGGGDVSGFNPEDTFIMGLLRVITGATLVGATTLRKESAHLWTPDFISKEFAPLWKQQRQALGLPPTYLNTFVTLSGEVPLESAVFQQDDIACVIFTSPAGKEKLLSNSKPTKQLEIKVIPDGEDFEVEVMKSLRHDYGVKTLLTEGGPTVFSSFLKHGLIDEMFLTEAPQLIGNSRDSKRQRPTFIEGLAFEPNQSRWQIASEKANFDGKEIGDYRYFRYQQAS